jgi:WD40 repeat protein
MFLKENFEFIKNNSIEGCPSALAWLPENSHIWKTYGSRMDSPWKLLLGRRTTWNQLEVTLRHSEGIISPAFSPDSMHIVSASKDNTVRIWNIATGECEAELKGDEIW